jgi:hypothetical protein
MSLLLFSVILFIYFLIKTVDKLLLGSMIMIKNITANIVTRTNYNQVKEFIVVLRPYITIGIITLLLIIF